MKKSILFLCLIASTVPAQTIPSPIDPGRSIDWSKAGVTGGIPDRTTIFATLNPGATVVQINNALASCPGGQVVFLSTGTYNLTSGIDFNGRNNITLRGAGPDKTFLIFTGSCACRGMGADICVGAANSSYYVETPTHTADWVAGFAKGTTQITLSNTTGLSAGMVLVMDQLNNDTDVGGVYVCETNGVCSDGGPGGGEQPNRAQEQFVKVVAVNGTTVTISPGVYMPNWSASQNPHAWWGTANGFSYGLGVEDLSVDNTNNASGNKSNIYLIWAFDCWVKNVRSLNSNRNHVWLYETAHSMVRDCYFYGTKNAASQSYGVESYMGSDNLVENNIFQHITGPLMGGGATPGLVEAYNYAIDDYYTASLTWMQGSNYAHAAGDGYILHEGNDGVGFTADLVHGTHNFLTAFRNYFTGWEPGKTAQTVPINLYAGSRYMNMVGNVLGTPGFHTNYESVPPSFTNHETSIYRLGDNGNVLPASYKDPLVKSTLLRWGNFDVATNTARFLASEVPSGIGQYANAMPVDHSLPASLYLTGKPAWWPETIPWPSIGPDVTGGEVAGLAGHAYKIPAHACYDNSTKTNGILNFNANDCYGNSYAGVSQLPDRAISGQVNAIRIFTNSIQGKILIQASSPENAQADVSVCAIDGKRILHKSINLKTENAVDVSGFSPGIYFVRLSNDKSASYQKMMFTRY
jgi:hypothetical protein